MDCYGLEPGYGFDLSRDLSAEQFRDLLEAAPDAMVIVDRDRRIVLVNRQTERLFGYDRAELVGHLVEVLLPDGVRAGHVAKREGYTTTAEVRPMGAGLELLARRKDGTEFPAEISLSPLQTSRACSSPPPSGTSANAGVSKQPSPARPSTTP